MKKFVKSQNAWIFPFKHYVVSGEIFLFGFFFFVIVFFVETKEGEHIRRKCTVPSAMTSNCMIGDVEYKLSQYADDTSLISEGSPLILDGILRKLDFSKNILS